MLTRQQHYLSTCCKGISIIEMSIAIIIIGAMLLFSLKGAIYIENMRAVLTANQITRFQSAVRTYEAEFKALPGDDLTAPSRFKRALATARVLDATVSSAGDGVINGKLSEPLNPHGEQFLAWSDLRSFGVLDGDPMLIGLTSMPENAFGGVFGFDEGNLGILKNSLCATRIPGRAAEIIDQRLDDGSVNTGAMLGTSRFSIEDGNHFDAPDKEPYNVEKEYIICIPVLL